MKKFSICAAILATTAGVGNITNVVKADEVPQPVTSTNTNKTLVSEQDLTKAQGAVVDAENNISQKVANVQAAEAQQSVAEKAVEDIKTNMATVNNAEQIINEQTDVINKHNEQKSKLDTDLNNAQSEVNTTRDAVNQARQADAAAGKAVTAAQKTVDDKKTELKKANEVAVPDTNAIQTELDDVNAQVTAKNAQITATSEKINAKQRELDAYKPVIKKVDLNPSERNAVSHTNPMDYEHNRTNAPKDKSGNPTMEPVAFQGAKVVEIEATKDMLDFQKALDEYRKAPYDYKTRTFKPRPVFRYKVDNRGLSNAFVKLLNELREKNGVAGNMQVDDAYLDYAQQRANEMQRNNKLSHKTALTAPGHKYEKGLENAISGFGDAAGSDGAYINFNRIVTNETLAYDMLLNWYDDFTNVTGTNHGHRRALLAPMGGKMGLALANTIGGNNVSRYAAFENNAHTGSTYSTDTDGTTYLETESESSKKYWSNINNFKDDALHPTFYGKPMKFIEDHHFVFVTRKQEGDNSALVTALNDLKALKRRQESERTQLVAKQGELTNKLSDAKRAQTQRTTAINKATDDLAIATAALASAKDTARNTEANLQRAQVNAERANNYVNHLTNRIAKLQDAINVATDKRDGALRVKNKFGNLTAQLTKAEQDKRAADKRVTDAKVALTTARIALGSAKAEVNRLNEILNIDKSLAVYRDKSDHVSAITRQTPTVDQLPAFDLNAELHGYKVTQNADGIGATTTVAPTGDAQIVKPVVKPAFDINAELRGYKTTQNADGIGATTTVTPTVDALPEFDLNAELRGYKTTQNADGIGATTTVAPTGDAQIVKPVVKPAFDIDAELRGYKTTQNADGIGATTTDAPTTENVELPAFDLETELRGYKVTQNADGIGVTTLVAPTGEEPADDSAKLPAFDLDSELRGYKVTQNADGIGATTTVAPTAENVESPAFNLNAELNGYKITQNADGIGATTTDAPTAENELPAFDLDAELRGYKVTQNADGIGATTTDAPIGEEPTVKPVVKPAFDLNAELRGYKVTQNADGIGATTTVAPTAEELPAFDLDAELRGYKTTQNADGIGATTIVAPIGEEPAVKELPTFDLDVELRGYKVTQNADGVGATPMVAPTATELPTFDLDAELRGYKTTQNADGIGATPMVAPVVENLPELTITVNTEGYDVPTVVADYTVEPIGAKSLDVNVADAWLSQDDTTSHAYEINNDYFNGTRGESRAALPNTGTADSFMTILAGFVGLGSGAALIRRKRG